MAADLEYVALPKATLIAASGKAIEHVYFITSGIGSVVPLTQEGRGAEAGLFGHDGFVPTSGIPAVELSSHTVTMQIEGDAYRMRYETYRHWMTSSPAFARIMIRCLEVFAVQLSYTVVSNAVHDINERLARWLLMCHDRVQGNDIGLTHDFIALMLAVRRPSVTTALHVLEGHGFIKGERGNIVMRNRPGLLEFAHDAYGRPEAEARRMMADLA